MLSFLILVALFRVDVALDTSHSNNRVALQVKSDGRAFIRSEQRAARESTKSPEWEKKIWCYYEYPNGPSPLVKLNMETWAHHAPDLEVVMVNDSNVEKLIPDLPHEYFMLPYASAKSDLLRAALLYHHGGIYMDTDFLVNRPVSEFMSKLETHDIVTYSDEVNKPSGDCGKYFSSNFMAGRKNNGFSRTWWENIKSKLTSDCPAGAFKQEKVCCHEKGENAESRHEHQVCHVPWAAMEHMKDPTDAQITDQMLFNKGSKSTACTGWSPSEGAYKGLGSSCKIEGGSTDWCYVAADYDGPGNEFIKPSIIAGKFYAPCSSEPLGSSLLQMESEGHLESKTRSHVGMGTMVSTLAPEFIDKLPSDVKLYCFQGDEAMTPHLNGEVYWQHWSSDNNHSREQVSNPLYDKRFACQADGQDLKCTEGNWGKSHRTIPNFFGRLAYHLFFSTTAKGSSSKQDVFSKSWLVSDMYKRSLGLTGMAACVSSSAFGLSSVETPCLCGTATCASGQRCIAEDASCVAAPIAVEDGYWSLEKVVAGDFGDADLDKSGRLDADEVNRLLSKTAVPKSLNWNSFDHDKDGQLSLKELEILAWKAPAYIQEFESQKPGASLVQDDKSKTEQTSAETVKAVDGEGTFAKTIWAFYEYNDAYPINPSPFVILNMETWKKYAPDMNVVLVNNSNIKELIPDLPDEYFKLGYASAKSDLLRAALIYHHGGLYMDTDFLLNKPIDNVIAHLKDHDVVTYSDNTGVPSGQCNPASTSSNFMAGRKGNAFSKIWWGNIKQKLAHQCDKRTYFDGHKLCCHLRGETQAFYQSRNCLVPWAALEHMKDPRQAPAALFQSEERPTQPTGAASLLEAKSEAEASVAGTRRESHALAPDLELITSLPEDLKVYCFAGNESFVPHQNGEVFWQPWDQAEDKHEGQTRKGDSRDWNRMDYERRFKCKSHGAYDLSCDSGTWGNGTRYMHNFFNRNAYHLFFSTTNKIASSKLEVLNKDWLLSEMYRRALGVAG
jgi:mannosyltransferase OCH1-like enzyme